MRIALIAGVVFLSAVCDRPALGSVVIFSTTRSVQTGMTSTDPGFFSDTRSGTELAPPNGSASWSASQISNVAADAITYSANYNAFVSGSNGTSFIGASVRFEVEFDVFGSGQQMQYAWNGYGINPPRLTDPSLTVTNLLTSGSTMTRALPPGHYVLVANDYISVGVPFFSSQTVRATGTITFLPSPGSSFCVAACGAMLIRRRR